MKNPKQILLRKQRVRKRSSEQPRIAERQRKSVLLPFESAERFCDSRRSSITEPCSFGWLRGVVQGFCRVFSALFCKVFNALFRSSGLQRPRWVRRSYGHGLLPVCRTFSVKCSQFTNFLSFTRGLPPVNCLACTIGPFDNCSVLSFRLKQPQSWR